MAKLPRIAAKIFGSGAGTNQISKFGSLFAGSPAFTTDPAEAQSLSNWLTGWFGAAIGGNAPAIEDMNAVHFALAYQIAYMMQAGVPEWDSTTVYYIGSIANVAGVQYVSQTDANTGNDPTTDDGTNWANKNAPPTLQRLLSGSGTYTTPKNCKWIRVRMVGGGGGGGNSGPTSGTGGSNGGDTTWAAHLGSTIVTAGGGFLASHSASAPGGAGGGATVNSPALNVISMTGNAGAGSQSETTAAISVAGGIGGAGPWGGAGVSAINSGGSAIANSGAGGAGSGMNAVANGVGGGGGGAGGYAEFIIEGPSASYDYAVGAKGNGQATVVNGGPGGDGGSGVIIVEEYYN